ncbi:hypothetical protein QTP70_016668 [Hemibagrus guttatus]|uniref:Uncharacterized protein n=1 Tax=Hemibagrus guttatus TaxID=175788 RepID=A0AAE0V6W3_9TELE|nr:hypothetical protein QTP70_016668 [Hemibagrus guttatus]
MLQRLLTIALNQIKPMYFQWKAATSHCPAHILDQLTVFTGIDKKPGSRPEFLLLIDESGKHVTEAQPPHPTIVHKTR